jgi:hypothetical protein
MPINFPSSPTSGSQYTYGSKTWQWNGYAWDIVTPTTISTFNGCTSSAITITGTANEVTVDTTCPNIVIGLPNNLVVQNLTVTGSLLVSGGITTQMSEVVLIEDNFVTLNANVTAGAPTENAGIIISRGASANVDLRWNETSDNWQFTNNGTDYWNLPINVVNTFNGLTGAVSFSTPLASSSATGVASFNGNDFTVSSTGHVGLTGTIARTNVNNQFSTSQTVSGDIVATQLQAGNDPAFGIVVVRNTDILYNTDIVGNNQRLVFSPAGNSVITLPSGVSGTVALVGTTVATVNGQTGAVGITGSGAILFVQSGKTGNFDARLASASATGVASFGNEFVVSAVGAVSLTSNYVKSINGSTGAITIQGLTGITASVSGQTIRLSHVVTNDNTSNTRYLAFYGVTSGVDTAKVDENLRYNPLTNTISAYGGLVLNGLSSGGVATPNQIVLTDPNNGGISLNSSNYIVDITSVGGAGDVSSVRLMSYDGLDNGWKATISPATFYSTDRTFTLPDDSGVIALTKNVATSVNGATGAVTITGAGAILFTQSGKTGTFNARLASASATGVASFGNEFVVSALGAVSLTSNYVKSINGSTGAVVSIATTGANTFTGLQTMNGGLTTNHLYVSNGATFNSRATFAGGLTTANLLVSNGATFNSSVLCNTGLSAYNLDILNYQSNPLFDVPGIEIGDVFGVDTGAKVVADFAASYFEFVGCNVLASQIFSNGGTLNLQTQGTTPTVNIGDYNVNNNGTCIKIDDNFTRVDINASSDVFIGNTFEVPVSYLRLDNNTKTTTFWNTSISGGDAKFGGIVTLNGGLSAGSGVTFGGRPSFMGGLSANNLYVSQGVTFNSTSVHTGLGTFNGGITSNHLYVSQGATFARLSVNNGDFLATTVGGEEGGEIHFGLAATGTSLTGAYVVVDIYQNRMRFFEQGGSNRGYYMDLSAASNAVGSQLVASAANTFTGLQTMNAGITSNNLYVSQGVTFAGTVISDTGYRISSSAINAQTGTSYTLTGTDNGKVVTFDNSSAVTVTIPTGLPVGFNCTAIQLGAGQVGFTNAAGLTMQSYGNQYKMIGQHASATIIEYTTNIVNLSGNLII